RSEARRTAPNGCRSTPSQTSATPASSTSVWMRCAADGQAEPGCWSLDDLRQLLRQILGRVLRREDRVERECFAKLVHVIGEHEAATVLDSRNALVGLVVGDIRIGDVDRECQQHIGVQGLQILL